MNHPRAVAILLMVAACPSSTPPAPIDGCLGAVCAGPGICATVAGTARCLCDRGAQIDPADPLRCVPVGERDAGDPCAGVDCSGHGTCAVASGAALCSCATGYDVVNATACVARVIDGGVNPCVGIDCSNRGTCAVAAGAALCSCAPGYDVVNATSCVARSTDGGASPCASITCSGHGTCALASGAPLCSCAPGYDVVAATTCVARDAGLSPCVGVTCSGAGQCAIIAGSTAACVCNAGFVASGLTCVASGGPVITTQPVSASVALGAVGTFSVVALGQSPLSYRWRRNGVDVSGATNSSFTTPAAVITDDGALFSVVVTNAQGSATSVDARLIVSSPCTPPSAGAAGSIVELGSFPVGFSPEYLAVGPAPSNDLFVTLSGSTAGTGKILRVNGCGAIVQDITLSVTPRRILLADDGKLYFTSASPVLGRFDPMTGIVTTIATAGPTFGLTVGFDGKVWFTEPTANKLASLNLINQQLIERSAPVGWNPVAVVPVPRTTAYALAVAATISGFYDGTFGGLTSPGNGIGVVACPTSPTASEWCVLTDDGQMFRVSSGSSAGPSGFLRVGSTQLTFPAGDFFRAANGRYYVSEPSANVVHSGTSPFGNIDRPFTMPTAASQPFSMAEAGGFVWVTERSARKLARITPP